MPTKRLSMRRIKQLLTMHFGAGASTRAIARELGIAPSTVREYLGRAAAAGIGWPLAADVTDALIFQPSSQLDQARDPRLGTEQLVAQTVDPLRGSTPSRRRRAGHRLDQVMRAHLEK